MLSMHQAEELAREQERKKQQKLDMQKQELIAAAEHAKIVRAAQLEQERRDEDMFKQKMAAKFAEDERIE